MEKQYTQQQHMLLWKCLCFAIEGLALSLSIIGLVAPWWLHPERGTEITLWGSKASSPTGETSFSWASMCLDANGDNKSNCSKIQSLSASVCLMFITQLAALICSGLAFSFARTSKCGASRCSCCGARRLALVSAFLS